jgi:hypothetical protein
MSWISLTLTKKIFFSTVCYKHLGYTGCWRADYSHAPCPTAYVTEDGEIQRTPDQRTGPSQKNEAKRIPPDSPTMVMYIVLWIFTLGTFLIGKVCTYSRLLAIFRVAL